MKNCIIFFLIAWSISATAQVRIGAVAGINFSDINNLDLVTTSRQANLNAGLMTDFRISKSGFHILAQALYAPMGYANSNLIVSDLLGNPIAAIESHRISYIQLPVYFEYIAKGKKVKFTAGLGPFISFKTGDKMKLKGSSERFTILPNSVKKINDILTGIALSVGLEWKSVKLSLEYKQSFSDIYQNRYGDINWRINSLGLSVGYFFKKKNK